jgi:hypothetical protein
MFFWNLADERTVVRGLSLNPSLSCVCGGRLVRTTTKDVERAPLLVQINLHPVIAATGCTYLATPKDWTHDTECLDLSGCSGGN